MASSLSALIPHLKERLEQPLPGHEAHLTMAPRSPARRADLSVDNRDCREAGVLVLLRPPDEDPAVVLTVRRDHLPDHAGQISFPGGQREGDESLPDTALREAEEEIALPPASVRICGRLTPLYIPPSSFCVHPFVGRSESAPDLRPTDEEVEHILQVRLARLLDPATRQTETRFLHGTDVEVPYYDVAGHTVWGATAMMLAEFLAVTRDAVASDQ
jgi:8-oxo-dGTP pyrophosphatase MutT (NUDIX family)